MEIGCSIGVLTALLAQRCDSLLGVDISEAALVQGRARCKHLPWVEFRRLVIPAEFPAGSFDLIMVSEVAYFWSPADLLKAMERIARHQKSSAHVVLVHWTPKEPDYPQSGDTVHETWLADTRWRQLLGRRREKYRIDVLVRT
jgi:ubiquinone/menaquinone biosynthesis C-methylase UbiE